MKIHEKYITRCIEIAKNGLGTTAPNPMVGCVIVHNENIIGEGFTSRYGGNHAEVNAINSVKDKTLLKASSLYVTLEPCSHFGKTPPCANLIIKHEIPNVIIGTIDTHSKVAGRGIEVLKTHNCNVILGVLENKCQQHHKRFFTYHNEKRPYIILKWAETADGFIAPESKTEQKPVWITNPFSRQLVHKWRVEEQAILVGKNTVLEDNPSLTARDWKGEHPIRVILDKEASLSRKFKAFDDSAKTISIKEITAKDICNKLYEANINSVIIEGGAKTLQLFIDANIWDEARVFSGVKTFNNGTKSPTIAGQLIVEEKIITDTLKVYVNN